MTPREHRLRQRIDQLTDVAHRAIRDRDRLGTVIELRAQKARGPERTRLTRAAITAANDHLNHCVYCGSRCLELACAGHLDLPALDPNYAHSATFAVENQPPIRPLGKPPSRAKTHAQLTA